MPLHPLAGNGIRALIQIHDGLPEKVAMYYVVYTTPTPGEHICWMCAEVDGDAINFLPNYGTPNCHRCGTPIQLVTHANVMGEKK